MNLYLDNIIFSLQKAGGISVVWYELIKRCLEDPEINVRFLEEENDNIFSSELNASADKRLRNPLAKFPVQVQRYVNPNKLKGKGIFHSSYYRISKSPQLLNVTTVHDFTYEYFRKGIAKSVHSFQKGSAIKNAHKIICVSENTKMDLLKFYPETNPEKIKVIYNGVDDAYRVEPGNSFSQLNELVPFGPQEYAVYVGERKSNHKNFKIAVKACKEANTPLVMVGSGKITEEETALFRERDFTNYTHLTGIRNEQLNTIYNSALCLIYPSSYEGFGIPIIEAQRAGCPVVASNNSSISEVAKDSAILIDDITTHNFAEKMELLKNNQSFTEQVIRNGLINSSRFSWDSCYKQTKKVYQELYEEYF
ncbi:glycosyltransferase family 4 protein [Sunxiuqinia sp. A32]|uniref:glycosyltransferase family 4 protein n=1 Tax=Sunxiuqinia sp. A32 TaxID=3461496 RepID=UPI004045D411